MPEQQSVPEGERPVPEDEQVEPGDEQVEPGDEQVEPAGRARLRDALKRPSRSQAVVGVLLAVLGFAGVTQVRSNELDDTYEGRREEDLIEILNVVTGTSDRARREINRLEQTRRNLQTDSNARQAAIDQAEERLQSLNILAGLVPVSGPGLRVTVTEQTGRVRIDRLLDMVQELRTAGAEAMEFNDTVRLAAQSSFQEVGGVIEVDGVPLESPYVLEVIGEPNTLNGGLTFPSGPVSNLRNEDGAEVDVDLLDSVEIKSVRELPKADFAEPAQGQ